MSNAKVEHHESAAEHHEYAAKHYREAANITRKATMRRQAITRMSRTAIWCTRHTMPRRPRSTMPRRMVRKCEG
jgi:hypothetical protein